MKGLKDKQGAQNITRVDGQTLHNLVKDINLPTKKFTNNTWIYTKNKNTTRHITIQIINQTYKDKQKILKADTEKGHIMFKSVFIPVPEKGNAKESSNYLTIVLISH